MDFVFYNLAETHLLVLDFFFFCRLLRIFYNAIILSTKKNSFTSSFPVWIPFNFFLALFVLTGTSSTTLNRKCECEHPCFVPYLRGAFPLVRITLVVKFFIEVPCQNEEVPSVPYLMNFFFYRKYMVYFLKYSIPVEMTIWFIFIG